MEPIAIADIGNNPLFKTYSPLIVTFIIFAACHIGLKKYVETASKKYEAFAFKGQILLFSLSMIGIIAVIIALPISDTLRGQLLSLLGLCFSGALAFSSTTFIGNILAGIKLKLVKNITIGDFITILDIKGRVSDIGLLDFEIQTEDSDLVTIPNMTVITNPCTVVRASGTVISAELSLGYDIPYTRIRELLEIAIAESGLTDGFVHVTQLGDFSIGYRAAGRLDKAKHLISAKSRLRESILDILHTHKIEIVSPNFMNTRAYDPDLQFVPRSNRNAPKNKTSTNNPEEILFDKANHAEKISKKEAFLAKVNERMAFIKERDKAIEYPSTDLRTTRLEQLQQSVSEAIAQEKPKQT